MKEQMDQALTREVLEVERLHAQALATIQLQLEEQHAALSEAQSEVANLRSAATHTSDLESQIEGLQQELLAAKEASLSGSSLADGLAKAADAERKALVATIASLEGRCAAAGAVAASTNALREAAEHAESKFAESEATVQALMKELEEEKRQAASNNAGLFRSPRFGLGGSKWVAAVTAGAQSDDEGDTENGPPPYDGDDDLSVWETEDSSAAGMTIEGTVRLPFFSPCTYHTVAYLLYLAGGFEAGSVHWALLLPRHTAAPSPFLLLLEPCRDTRKPAQNTVESFADMFSNG